ncbi:DUF2612 domain-containing protein [Candidatus Pacearchaeota archaeon]|nr:DUF2612 domain-containing protein [Candidatus Pacearchaeota archaeon]
MSSLTVNARFLEKLFHVFRDSPEILALLSVESDPMQDTVDAIDFLLGALTIDDRKGEQLDYLGTRIGVKRPAEQEPQENLFTLIDEGEVGLESQGFSDEDYPSEGGYFADENGLPLVESPDQQMDDAGYRRLLKQKGSSFRSKAIRENLFKYLIDFGSRCLINDDNQMDIEFDPIDYYSLSDFEKWYVINKGFKPAAISTGFRENMRNGDSI